MRAERLLAHATSHVWRYSGMLPRQRLLTARVLVRLCTLSVLDVGHNRRGLVVPCR